MIYELPDRFMSLKKYRKKADQVIHAIQVDLELISFNYRKWGDNQTCKAGDWLVENNGNVYTVDQQVFADTYLQIAPATYKKIAPVWARQADEGGSVETKEGRSYYKAGDYIVANQADGSDAWCMGEQEFHDLYEVVE